MWVQWFKFLRNGIASNFLITVLICRVWYLSCVWNTLFAASVYKLMYLHLWSDIRTVKKRLTRLIYFNIILINCNKANLGDHKYMNFNIFVALHKESLYFWGCNILIIMFLYEWKKGHFLGHKRRGFSAQYGNLRELRIHFSRYKITEIYLNMNRCILKYRYLIMWIWKMNIFQGCIFKSLMYIWIW